MQVLKRFAMFFLVLILMGCNNRLTDNRIELSDQQYDIIDYDVVEDVMSVEGQLKVGVLLPLTGKASGIGLGMQNSMFMALDDLKNNKLVLKFYDTQSTEEGAAISADKAIEEGAQMILGPLMSNEVRGASEVASSYDIPIVSFTTSPQVLKKGVYSMGLLNGEQVDNILSYAVSQNRKKIAILVPDNITGLNVIKSAIMSALAKDITISKVVFYNPENIDFSEQIKNISEEESFDAILIADSGNRLKTLASILAYNDIMYPDVLFMGTSAWDNTNLSKETMLYHGVYPMVSKSYSSYFTEKYNETFGEQPRGIYAFAYDGVLLASVLTDKKSENLNDTITSSNGFIGINGYFRILPTGQSRHNLEIMEVTKDGAKVIAKSPSKAQDYIENEIDIRYVSYEKLPEFYGKSSSEVLNWLYNN